MKGRILLADDHSIVTSGLRFSLFTLDQRYHIDTAESCAEIMSKLKTKTFTHIIADIGFPDGTITEILPNIISLYPKIKTMIFSMQPAHVYADAIKKYGVHHYIEKSASNAEIMLMLNAFLTNIKPAQTRINSLIENPFTSLATRELEVLQYLLKGNSTNSIAEKLNVTASTVSTMKKRIFEKVECSTMVELSSKASSFNISF